MKFPEWWEAPGEIQDLDGHCGIIAAWSVLHHFGKSVAVPKIISSRRHTKRYGVFSVNLAAGLKELGLQVSFHSEQDDKIGGFEKRGRIPIVLYDTPSASGHFSPLLGIRGELLRLPLAENGAMSTDDFLAAWSAPGILKQCVIAGR